MDNQYTVLNKDLNTLYDTIHITYEELDNTNVEPDPID